VLECALTLARNLAYIWPRCPHPILPVCNSSIKDISYELYFLPIIRIYPVFHISLLESADLNTPIRLAPKIHPDL
jgi:hypothetical protein